MKEMVLATKVYSPMSEGPNIRSGAHLPKTVNEDIEHDILEMRRGGEPWKEGLDGFLD